MERHFNLKGASVFFFFEKKGHCIQETAVSKKNNELMQWQTSVRSQDTHQTGKKQ